MLYKKAYSKGSSLSLPLLLLFIVYLYLSANNQWSDQSSIRISDWVHVRVVPPCQTISVVRPRPCSFGYLPDVIVNLSWSNCVVDSIGTCGVVLVLGSLILFA